VVVNTTDIRDLLSEHEKKILASLQGAPRELASATLEGEAHLRHLMLELGLLKSRSDKPHLIEVTPEGWGLIEELSALWPEEELVAYFRAEVAKNQKQMP
jgi:hypothetical protein